MSNITLVSNSIRSAKVELEKYLQHHKDAEEEYLSKNDKINLITNNNQSSIQQPKRHYNSVSMTSSAS